jgi:hypothetical protein
MSWIKEMMSATIFGENWARFCGKKKINGMNHRIHFVVEKVKELKRVHYAEKQLKVLYDK